MAKKKRGSAPKAKPPTNPQVNSDNSPDARPGISRRTVLKAMGVSAGAMSLDLPHSLVAPVSNPAQQTDPGTPPPAAGGAEAQQAPQIASVADGEFLTTNQGLRVSDDQNTLHDRRTRAEPARRFPFS